MAKAESPLTPERLLAEIRAGTRKDEIMRTYRTTEAELASILSLLYRTREIRKEEFNDFFEGVSLKKDSTPGSAPDAAPEKERDQTAAPSKLSLSGFFSLRSRGTTREQPEKPAQTETAEPVRVASDAEAAPQVKANKEISLEEALGFKDSQGASIESAESSAAVLPPANLDSESLGRPLLERILARLDAIEIRLARIEKKLDTL